MASSNARLTPETCTLLVVDVQEKLIVHIPDRESLVRNIGFLLDVASVLTVPVQGTEQYPKGLGPTVSELSRRLPQPLPVKTCFSCVSSTSLPAHPQRTAMVVTGMETHVCIAQTVFDLLEQGITVFLPVDAVAARFSIDHDTALRRMERAGAVLTTVEAVAFEWLRDAAHPQFKAVSRLVVERAAGS